ncbi:hypothetical protein TIFTF001_003496 [Ficus carica]|uniref:Uncharacterized protein n=1 Tax=Ficus carica TaxID=3494 RepID=A0AA87ZBQ8_FICCA|nr:hypothetical protein TIFTF001_003496 [Ficus carica]
MERPKVKRNGAMRSEGDENNWRRRCELIWFLFDGYDPKFPWVSLPSLSLSTMKETAWRFDWRTRNHGI